MQREAPNSIEAEQALLGAILINNEAYYAVADFLLPVHFYETLHRRTFDVVGELIRMGKRATPVTIKAFLPANEMLGDMTVGQYLARLASEAVTIINAPDYGRVIYQMWLRRGMITIGDDMVRVAYDMPVDLSPEQLADRTTEQLGELHAVNAETIGAVTIGDAVKAAIEMANAAYMADGEGSKKAGISYRVPSLERLIGPLYPGQFIILGGATKQGKTALAGQVAIGAALEGTPVWIYSGEMTSTELAMREIARQLKIPVWKQKRGKVTEFEFEQLHAFHQRLAQTPILIQNQRLTLPQLKERCRRIVRKRGRTVLIIDHIGLIERDKATRQLSEWEFGQEVTRECKAMARELECPVIGCAQLKKNTFAENKGPVTERFLNQIITRKPRYTDLIGATERDADHVIIPFRPDVLLAEHQPMEGSDLYLFWQSKVNEWLGKAQIVLALSREMRWPQHVDVGWDGASTTFFEIGAENEQTVLPAELRENPLRLF